MSDNRLPENVEDWPDDPFKLLGVEFGVESQDLRRAYHRLIRIYKPEKHPEHFRRIRAAFENIQQIAQLFPKSTEPPAPTLEQLPTPSPAIDPNDSTTHPTLPPPQQLSPSESQIKSIWDAVRSGQEATAYQQLVELQQKNPREVASYFRLYWLLRLYPGIQPDRSPIDWLVEGLIASDLNQKLLELYQEEIKAWPNDKLMEHLERLVSQEAPPILLRGLTRTIFFNAGDLDSIDRLTSVVDRTRRSLSTHADHWLLLHYHLAVRIAWSDQPEVLKVLQRCEEEIKSLDFLANTMGPVFDRFDQLATASAAWRVMKKQKLLPPEVLNLIAECWYRPMGLLRVRIQNLLHAIRTDPDRWMDKFDLIYKRVPKAPVLINQFYQEIASTQEEDRSEECPPETLFDLVRQLLVRIGHKYYAKQRKKVLEFCLKEWINPYQIAQIECPLSPAWANLWNEYAQGIIADWSLFHIYHACRFSLRC